MTPESQNTEQVPKFPAHRQTFNLLALGEVRCLSCIRACFVWEVKWWCTHISSSVTVDPRKLFPSFKCWRCVNANFCALLSHILVPSLHVYGIAVVRGQCCLHSRWINPMQWINLRWLLVCFPKSVPPHFCPWCVGPASAIISTSFSSTIIKLCTHLMTCCTLIISSSHVSINCWQHLMRWKRFYYKNTLLLWRIWHRAYLYTVANISEKNASILRVAARDWGRRLLQNNGT